MQNKEKDRQSILLAFAINAIFLLLVVLFCDMKYEVSDDFIVDTILSGAYGNGYDEHLLFSNILYGYFLKLLYELIPIISWYFVAQILVAFCSLWAVTYIILQRNNRCVGILVAVIFVSFFSDDLYILVQFTKTAAVAMCAGGALILHGIWDKKKMQKAELLLGGVLALIGSMIRFDAIFIALVFLLLIMIKSIYESCKSKHNISKVCVACMICLLYVCGAGLIYQVDGMIWDSEPEYKAYKIYNTQRAAVTDVNSYGYDSVKDELKKIGISENDYEMLNSWNFLDQDYFTSDKLIKIAEIKKAYSDSITKHFRYVISKFYRRHYEKYTVAIGLIILFGCVLILDTKKTAWQFGEVCVTAALLMYFIYSGRVVYRVEYAIFVCAAISMATSIRVKTEFRISSQRKIVCCCMCIVLCKIPLYIPDTNYLKMSDEEYAQYISDCFYQSWDFKIEKYRCCVSKRRPHEMLMNLFENDSDHYYLIDFNTAIQLLYYNYKPWIRISQNTYSRYSYFGGVIIGYPDNYQTWEEKEIDCINPYKSINNDNLYIVDTLNHNIRLNYLKEHYNSNEYSILINTVSGFDIWKYSN